MKCIVHSSLLVLSTVLALGCSEVARSNRAESAASKTEVVVEDGLVQFSTLSALAAGDYEGKTPLSDVLADGDFGLGTFDQLDGEMIVLDGKIYQALADATVREADLRGSTPFAAVTFFSEDGRIDEFAIKSLAALDRQLDEKLTHRNSPYAIKIAGRFAHLTLRSVKAQTPPFRPLVEVVKQQSTWEHDDLSGTLIGIRCPAWMGTLNVSGYHWHFLSDDRKIGGHVLECKLDRGVLQYDLCTSLLIRIPESQHFQKVDLNQVQQRDIDKIERQQLDRSQRSLD